MAWGCFCWIPCPYKKWNEDDRIPMVAMLPLVGTGLGLVTALVWWIIGILSGPAAPGAISAAPLLCGAVVTAAYFVMTGFIHLDGFMDVSDAVMPRHPRLEERVRILKDPHTGSFAAISMALMFLIFGASAAALSRSWAAGALILIAVATTSRCVSAISVICCEPMQTSQYAKAGFPDQTTFPKALPTLIITVLVTAACVCAALLLPETLLGIPKGMAGVPNAFGDVSNALSGTSDAVLAAGSTDMSGATPAFAGGGGHGIAPGVFGNGPFSMGRALLAWSVIGSAAVCAITAVIIGALDRKALGGMNGDISGHLITSGEMAGMLAAAIFLT